jgi:hypothetical protein
MFDDLAIKNLTDEKTRSGRCGRKKPFHDGSNLQAPGDSASSQDGRASEKAILKTPQLQWRIEVLAAGMCLHSESLPALAGPLQVGKTQKLLVLSSNIVITKISLAPRIVCLSRVVWPWVSIVLYL